MRVLAVDQFSEMGGAQYGFWEALDGFSQRGWQVHCAVPDGPLIERLRPLCGTVSVIPCGPYRSASKTPLDAGRFALQLPRQVRKLRQILARHKIDALYVNGPRLVPAAALASGTRPLVFHSHSVVTQRSVAHLVHRALNLRPATVLASSRFVTKWLAPAIPPERISVIYNGIAGWNRPTPVPRRDFRRIGVLGRIAPEKGQLTFARAAQIVAREMPGLEFVIAGAPVFADETYLASVRDESPPSTRFPGWIQPASEFYEQVDLLVVPSAVVDANPRVIPEAFSAGVPVVAFRSGGIAELVEHGDSGLLVDEHTPEALATTIIQGVRDPGMLNRIASSGYQRWLERFTLPRFQSEVCEAIERAVERTPLATSRARAAA